jgi:uncharacterized protein YjbJ (UPF0337 family)
MAASNMPLQCLVVVVAPIMGLGPGLSEAGALGCRQVPTVSGRGVLPSCSGVAPKVDARRPTRIPRVAAGATDQEKHMNSDRIEGNWKQVKGKIKEQWGKLTDDDLDVIAGKRDQLLGRIQERHGVARDEAEKQVRHFEERNPTFKFEKSQ